MGAFIKYSSSTQTQFGIKPIKKILNLEEKKINRKFCAKIAME